MKIINFAFVLLLFHTVHAHEGRLDGSSGHNCTVSPCAGSYHYHYGSDFSKEYSSPSNSVSDQKPKLCPKFATYSFTEDECFCNEGYQFTANKTSCLKIPEAPENGYLTERGFGCNDGYRRVFDKCKKTETTNTEVTPQKPIINKIVPKDFSDVEKTHRNIDAINYMRDKNIVKGYDDGTFKPENQINRAEFTKIIIASKYEKSDIENCSIENLFSDVQKTDWFYGYVCLAKDKGIIQGYSDGTFKPAQNIALTEAAKIILETKNISTDSDEIWYKPYIEKLGELGSIPDDINDLASKISRSQMAEIVFRIETRPNKKSKIYSDFIETSQIDLNDNPIVIEEEELEENNDVEYVFMRTPKSASQLTSEYFESRLQWILGVAKTRKKVKLEETMALNGDEFMKLDEFYGTQRKEYRDGKILDIWALADLDFPYRVNGFPYFKGYMCTDDCSGHIAGYEWARKNNISSCNELSLDTLSFREGCLSFLYEEEDIIFSKYASCPPYSNYILEQAGCFCDFGYQLNDKGDQCIEITKLKKNSNELVCEPYMSFTENGHSCYHAPDMPGWNECTDTLNSSNPQNVFLRWLNLKTTPLTYEQERFARLNMDMGNYNSGMECYNAKFE